MSCVICMEAMEPQDFADHVRVFHPEDARELLGEEPLESPFAA